MFNVCVEVQIPFEDAIYSIPEEDMLIVGESFRGSVRNAALVSYGGSLFIIDASQEIPETSIRVCGSGIEAVNDLVRELNATFTDK